MRRLNGMDASFVYGETPSWHMHGGTLFVLDPSTAPGGFDVNRLRAGRGQGRPAWPVPAPLG